MKYGYVRVGNKNKSKEGIEKQIRELVAMGCNESNIFKECGSGIKRRRPILRKLLKKVKEGDTILATDISRITRSREHFNYIVELAKKKKIKLQFGTLILDYTNNSNSNGLEEGRKQLWNMGIVDVLRMKPNKI